ncbi:MAG: Fic family protein [Candidatus Omnitrophica bacterium]|nr:Fic family protein [Candidatus Omnitrophota bacterium]
MKYIWQLKEWPKLVWKAGDLLRLLGEARLEQGKLLSKVSGLGFKLKDEAQADVLTEEVVKTSAIEGEKLNPEQVRSSVARHLGLPTAGLPSSSRSIDGLVEVLLDATQNYSKPLTANRVKRWQAALFPTGQSGLRKIRAGKWRRPDDEMQVVSGPIGREKVHYEAPPGEKLDKEMKQFFDWWQSSLKTEDGLLRSGVAHFYFVTIHPFEDGNGRIARALTDMALAQDENLPIRYYSLSSQIMGDRDDYYNTLEKAQKAGPDITEWLEWYLKCYVRAVQKSETLTAKVMAKTDFWQEHRETEINQRQRKVLNRLLDAGDGGFQGGLTTRKYVSMTKTSRATAFREISDLLEKGLLKQNKPKGRSVSYDLNW